MSLPSIRRFYTEDYPSAPEWFRKHISTLNQFSDPMYLLVSKGLTFAENFNAQTYTFTVRAGASASLNTATITTKISGKPQGLLKVAANVLGNVAAPITSAIDITWYSNGSTVQITSITGLTSGTQYSITVLIF